MKRSFPFPSQAPDRWALVLLRVLTAGLPSTAGNQGWHLDPPALWSPQLTHVWSVAQLLIAALRLGFRSLPEFLLTVLSLSKALTGQTAPLLFQAALADVIDKGRFSLDPTRARKIHCAITKAGKPLAVRSRKPAIQNQ